MAAERKTGASSRKAKKETGKKSENRTLVVILTFGVLLLAGIAYLLILSFRGAFNGIPRRVEDLPYRSEVAAAQRDFDVEEARIYAVIQVESSFRPDALSPAGARGLMQMLPSTYLEVCAEMGVPYDPEALFEPEKNIYACTRYLRQLYDLTGSWRWAHVAYFAGIGNALTWERQGLAISEIPNEKARIYSERIDSAYDAYSMMFKAYNEAKEQSTRENG